MRSKTHTWPARRAEDRGPAAPTRVPTPRMWDAAAWNALAMRIEGMTQEGGTLSLNFVTANAGNVRWARNRISTSGDLRQNTLTLHRSLHTQGEQSLTLVDPLDDEAMRNAVAYIEHAAVLYDRELFEEYLEPPFQAEDYLQPTLWFDSTWAVDGAQRATAVAAMIRPAVAAGMVSAGYLEVKGFGVAVTHPWQAMALYYPVTEAQYSVTVRDPQGTASGWAGVNWGDWTRLDLGKLSQIALDKCLQSRNPVAIEPGRYTAILEPQAVYDFTQILCSKYNLSLFNAIADKDARFIPYSLGGGRTKIGLRLIDERLSVHADPMDPDLGFVPFDADTGEPYRPAVWFSHGVLRRLGYTRREAYDEQLGNKVIGQLNSENYRIDGEGMLTSLDEMMATTKRGVLVTRFTDVNVLWNYSTTIDGYTRDGLWLIENGKISHPIKNFRFVESVLASLNRVEQIGVPQRVFSPGKAVVVPALKINDFNFVGLIDAV